MMEGSSEEVRDGGALRIALGWLPTGDELDLIEQRLPAGTELAVPTEDDLSWSRFACTPAALTRLLTDADALIGWATPTKESIEGASRLRFIAWLHAGCDQLDLNLIASRGINVANVRGANAVAVAEHGMALLLGLAKRLRQNDEAARAVQWQGWWEPESMGVELLGKSVCLVGYGNLGRAMARMCQGFGMEVKAIRRSPDRRVEGDVLIGGPQDERALLSSADFVVLAMPLTLETRGYLNAERLGWLKPTSYVVNVARGELIQERAIYDALVNDRLAGFASEVWWNYADAMPPGHHFGNPSRLGVHRLPNVLASTEAAANVVGAKERMLEYGVESLAAWAVGDKIPRLVDLAAGY